MFNNIGNKIKTLVTIIVVFSSLLFIFLGFYLIFREESDTLVRLTGLLIAIVGPIMSWISGFLMYGFGELVEKVASIEAYLKPSEKPTQFDDELKNILEKQIKETEETEEAPYYAPEVYEDDIPLNEDETANKENVVVKNVKHFVENFRF